MIFPLTTAAFSPFFLCETVCVWHVSVCLQCVGLCIVFYSLFTHVLCWRADQAAVRAADGRDAAHCAGQESRTQRRSAQRLHRRCALQHTATILHCFGQVNTHQRPLFDIIPTDIQYLMFKRARPLDWMTDSSLNRSSFGCDWQFRLMLIWASRDIRVHTFFTHFILDTVYCAEVHKSDSFSLKHIVGTNRVYACCRWTIFNVIWIVL